MFFSHLPVVTLNSNYCEQFLLSLCIHNSKESTVNDILFCDTQPISVRFQFVDFGKVSSSFLRPEIKLAHRGLNANCLLIRQPHLARPL